jgi:hypothetical protein
VRADGAVNYPTCFKYALSVQERERTGTVTGTVSRTLTGTGTGTETGITGTGTGSVTGTVSGTVTGRGTGTETGTVTETVTISISAQTLEQQTILYTHKHCEIKHIGNMRFLFCFFYI